MKRRMSCEWGSVACVAQHAAFEPPPPLWRYNRTICTGLGDRLGAMLTVAALAHAAHAHVEMKWCVDPSVVYGDIRPYIPAWTGYHYPLAEFLTAFHIPPNIRLVERYSDQELPEVAYTGNELVAQEARDQTYTLAHRTTRLGPHPMPYQAFLRGYHVVGAQLQLVARYARDVVLHIRAPDDNTYNHGWDPALFCTRKVVRRVQKLGHKVVCISNNFTWASQLPLEGLVFAHGSAFEDVSRLLSARAIIQHAPPGYSSYSNVPSMAHGVPLISTYNGPHHRFRMFMADGDVPSEFYTCSTMRGFVDAFAE